MDREQSVNISRSRHGGYDGRKESDMWSEGTIGINAFSNDHPQVICWYCIKHFENGSEFGIDGGRISKLEIRIDGKTTCHYDRGWDLKPKDEATQQALDILVAQYN